MGFLVIESHSSHPMLPLHLFKNPTFAIDNVVSVLVFFTLVSLLFIFSLFLQQVQGYSAAGMRFLPLNIDMLCKRRNIQSQHATIVFLPLALSVVVI